jgi:hypothetical protein
MPSGTFFMTVPSGKRTSIILGSQSQQLYLLMRRRAQAYYSYTNMCLQMFAKQCREWRLIAIVVGLTMLLNHQMIVMFQEMLLDFQTYRLLC